MPQLDRSVLIGLLERLEGPDEKDVLAAAREVARSMKESGVSWDDLLVASEREVVEVAPADPDSDAGNNLSAEETDEARSEIAALLALDGISDETRAEIVEFRGDLGEGRIEKADLRYIRALRARLS